MLIIGPMVISAVAAGFPLHSNSASSLKKKPPTLKNVGDLMVFDRRFPNETRNTP